MSEGYPDYARLSAAGGYELYAGTGLITRNEFLFRGYVGPWPYVNLFTNLVAGADTAQLYLSYYADSTFTGTVGYRIAIRNNPTFASTQYANLSPWLGFFYESASGGNMTWSAIGLYGTTGYAPQTELASLDVPVLSTSNSVAAGGDNIILPQHIQPGGGTFMISTAVTSWYVNFFYWNYNANAYEFYAQINSSWAGSGGSFDLPMIDAPMKVDIHNNSAAAGTINCTWLSK